MLIRCPWPPAALKPNSRTHWGLKARATNAYRYACATLAREQNAHKCEWPDGPIGVHLTFYPPSAHKRDDDNLETAFKAGRDGLADAMRVDDNRFKVTREVGGIVSGGCVVVRIDAPATVSIPLRGVIT